MDFVMTLASLWGVLGVLWGIFLVMAGFTAVIFVHELGHFLMAKKVGIRVERFAIGFGPRLFGVRKGETDYCVNLLLLGGYVKMSGQEDFRLEKSPAPDPRAYNNKPVGSRMAVVSAGVIMNVIFAVVLFMISFLAGIRSSPNKVGAVGFGVPAYGRIFPGDTILETGGKRTKDFMDIRLNVALHDDSEGDLPVVVRRRDGTIEEVKLTPAGSPALEGLPSIGVEPDLTLRLAADLPEDYPFGGGLKAGDEIVEADGEPVQFYSDLARVVRAGRGKPIEVVARRRRDGEEVEVRAVLAPQLPAPGVRTDRLNVLGARPRLKVVYVDRERPGAKELAEGDIVLSFGERQDPNFQQWQDACQTYDGKSVPVAVLRDGQRQTVEVRPESSWARKRPTVGVVLAFEQDQVVFGQMDPDSILGRAGLSSGSAIVHVAGPMASTPRRAGTTQPESAPDSVPSTAPGRRQTTIDWGELCRVMLANAGRTVTVSYRFNERVSAVAVAVPPADQWADQCAFYPPPLPLEPYRVLYSAEGNPALAAWMGVEKTWQFIKQAYVTILRLVSSNKFGIRHATGPVGIAVVSYQRAKHGLIELLYFLGLISANLAVINFLPLPIVDGGLFVFLIVEKIMRRPVSIRIQQISQIIGIVLIISVFLLVTWQDIIRFFPH